MQNLFIECVNETYLEIIKVMEQKIKAAKFDLLQIFEPCHISRVRTFVKWFLQARKVTRPERPTDKEKEFLRKKDAFVKFLDVLKYSLWPSAPDHISLRKNFLRIEGLDEGKISSNSPPAFKTFFDNEEKESSDPTSKHYHLKPQDIRLNTLRGFKQRTCFERHCDLGHPSDEILF